MATVQKLKWIGYVDYCTAVSQMVLSLTCTVVSLYYYLFENEGGKEMPYFAPALNLTITAVVLFVNGGQLICAKEFIKRRSNFISVAEVKRLRHHWIKWNWMTLLVDLVWFPYFSITAYTKPVWPLTSILICFLVTISTRLVVSCVMISGKMEPRPIPVVYVVPPMEMVEIGNLD